MRDAVGGAMVEDAVVSFFYFLFILVIDCVVVLYAALYKKSP